ncbi:MAG: hypothetical protein HYY16_14925 [Planctomycetes bacterium]|nr:hypothetical protein [Planctomycetota bacterium]
MSKRIGSVLTALSMAVLLAPQAWADVLPSKRAQAGDEACVQEQLTRVGVSAAEAREQAASLTGEELTYFAGGNRVQVVAGLYMEEWLTSVGFLGFLGALSFVVVDSSKK